MVNDTEAWPSSTDKVLASIPFAAFSNEVTASTQSIINAVLLVLFLIYLNNEHIFTRLLRPVKQK